MNQRIQHRQILAEMGIDCWIDKNAQPVDIADIVLEEKTVTQQIQQPSVIAPVTTVNHNTDSSIDSDNLNITNISTDRNANELNLGLVNLINNDEVNSSSIEVAEIASQPVFEQLNEQLVDDKEQYTETNTEITTPSVTQNKKTYQNSERIAPFTIQAVHYHNRVNSWVLMVDTAQLSDSSRQMWDNLIKALKLTTDELTFPICEGVDTQDIANATLSGFIFKLAKSESVKIASLTHWIKGLNDNRRVALPLLDDMIKDPLLKRQFWQSIN